MISLKSKTLSLVMSLLFTMTSTLWAMPQAGIEVMLPRETPNFFHVEIPENLATIEEIYEAPPKTEPRSTSITTSSSSRISSGSKELSLKAAVS